MLTVSDNHIVLGGGGGGGDVVGAVSSTDNAIARFDGVTGKVVQNSNVTIDDVGRIKQGATSYSALTLKNSGSSFSGALPYGTVAIGDIATPGFAGNGFVFANATAGIVNLGMVCNADTMFFASLGASPTVMMTINSKGVGFGVSYNTVSADIDTASLRCRGAFHDNVNSSGADGQVLKKVGGLVIWADP